MAKVSNPLAVLEPRDGDIYLARKTMENCLSSRA